MDRRDELAEGALEHVLVHGVIGLSLRPLAAALDTSDRMLIYHFGSRDGLVDEVLDRARRRLADSLAPPGPDVADAGELVRHLWRSLNTPVAAGTTRLYLEVCVLAVAEPARWRPVLDRWRAPFREPLQGGLEAFGAAPARSGALADLVLDTLDGASLDRLVSGDPTRADAAVDALADLLGTVSASPDRP